MTANKVILSFIIAVIAISGLFAISANFSDRIPPSVLRVGVLPDESAEVLRKRYAPLLNYLSASIGINTQLVLPSDYADLSRLFENGEIELAYFGGLTFVKASISSDAQPLVMRDIDMRFVSYFLARSNDDSKQISDFEGMHFSFGSELSTSGHLMPRYFMQSELQIEPESYFSVVDYSGSHDRTAFLVRDGDVDLGVANSLIIKKMIEDGRLQENELQVVWETPPYVDYVWAVQKNLGESVKNKLRDAFLELDSASFIHKDILASLGASSFLPASSNDFRSLKVTAKNLGMLETGNK